MEEFKKKFALLLAETGALFFQDGLIMKDGRPTPYFVNMGMFRTGRMEIELGSLFSQMMRAEGLVEKTDIILGPSYKGSAIALAACISLYNNYGVDLFFEYDRKEVKTYGEGSQSARMFVNHTFFKGCRIFVVDDVVTTMATKYELIEKIKQEADNQGFSVTLVGVGIAVDRQQTMAVYGEHGEVVLNIKGDNAVETFTQKTGIPVYTIAGIREIVLYLYQERVPVSIEGEKKPLDDGTMTLFNDYLELYGT
jgi:orotate phosphoribosyltransferase